MGTSVRQNDTLLQALQLHLDEDNQYERAASFSQLLVDRQLWCASALRSSMYKSFAMGGDDDDDDTVYMHRPVMLDFIVVIDVEATCREKQHMAYTSEIIEWPAKIIDCQTLKCTSTYRSFVRPTRVPQLDAFCTRLTTITQAQVDDAPTFAEMFVEFELWLAENHLFPHQQPYKWAILTDGPWDLAKFAQSDCLHHLGGLPRVLRTYINIRKWYSDYWNNVKHCLHMCRNDRSRQQRRRGGGQATMDDKWTVVDENGRTFELKHSSGDGGGANSHKMDSMLQFCGMTFVGAEHSGISDVHNIARIARYMMAHGSLPHVNEELVNRDELRVRLSGLSSLHWLNRRRVGAEVEVSDDDSDSDMCLIDIEEPKRVVEQNAESLGKAIKHLRKSVEDDLKEALEDAFTLIALFIVAHHGVEKLLNPEHDVETPPSILPKSVFDGSSTVTQFVYELGRDCLAKQDTARKIEPSGNMYAPTIYPQFVRHMNEQYDEFVEYTTACGISIADRLRSSIESITSNDESPASLCCALLAQLRYNRRAHRTQNEYLRSTNGRVSLSLGRQLIETYSTLSALLSPPSPSSSPLTSCDAPIVPLSVGLARLRDSYTMRLRANKMTNWTSTDMAVRRWMDTLPYVNVQCMRHMDITVAMAHGFHLTSR